MTGRWIAVLSCGLLVGAGCNQQKSSKEKTGPAAEAADDEHETRPDDTGADPDWFKGGLYFSSAIREGAEQTGDIKLENLPYQSCNYAEWPDAAPTGVGVPAEETESYPDKALYWSFDSKEPRDSSTSTFEIWIAADSPPAENTTYEFNKSSAGTPTRQWVGYTMAEPGKITIFATVIAPSNCQLTINRSETLKTGETSRSADTGKLSEVHRMFLGGAISCSFAWRGPEEAKLGTLNLKADLACSGLYLRPL